MGRLRESFPAADEFGVRVRRRRQELGWSLERLSEQASLHWTYIGQVERGERNVSLRNIIRIAEALDVNPGALMDGLHS